MTEDDYRRLNILKNFFVKDIAASAAKIPSMFDLEDQPVVLCILQDCTSLYSPYCHDEMTEQLSRLRIEHELISQRGSR